MIFGNKTVNEMNKKELEFRLRNMYEVSNVETGYEYWFAKLLNFCLPMFSWSGLPDSLPQREIEIQLQIMGHCNVIVWDGKLTVVHGSLYGFDEYYRPTDFTYAQPVVGSGNHKIDGFDSLMFWNSSLQNNIYGVPIDGSLFTFIARYSRQLADIESTINIYAVNTRKTDYPIAKNDKVRSSLDKFFDKLRMGTHSIVTDDQIIESFVDVPIPSSTRGSDSLGSLLDSRDKILEQFFRDIGIKFRNPKKGNMIEEEVESDEQVLIVSLDDMLECRKRGAELLNSKFRTNISVDINEKYKRMMYRDNTSMSGFVDETVRDE